jgi:hypothetical protein
MLELVLWYPLPRGVFGDKVFVFNGLRCISVCKVSYKLVVAKILAINKLAPNGIRDFFWVWQEVMLEIDQAAGSLDPIFRKMPQDGVPEHFRLREDNRQRQMQERDVCWETVWWRSGFLRCAAHKTVIGFGRNDGSWFEGERKQTMANAGPLRG